jgi:fructokinase
MAQDQSEDGFVIYNEGIGPTMTALWPNLAEIVQSASLLVIGSNTLVHQPERSVTFAACLYANHFGIPYIFDANLRLACWPDGREAIDIAQQLIRSAFVTKMNVAEAALITGFDDPDRAAFEILSMGTALVILTLGGDGVLARGAISVDLLAVSAMPVDTTGAGDAITAALVAELQAHELSFTAVHGGLERGIELAARVTERFGATDVATGPPLQRCGSDLATHL